MVVKPYVDIGLGKNRRLRVFNPFSSEKNFVWHRDKKDRKVSVLFNVDWKFQFDNELPFSLSKELFIKKCVYHRIIKGKMPLIIKIEEND